MDVSQPQPILSGRQRHVEHAFELPRAVREAVLTVLHSSPARRYSSAMLSAREHRDLQRVARWALFSASRIFSST